ncbi:hypothetical protein GQ53DRAFT_880143, partial [Thozetella sp. PMI_491]
IGYDVADGFIYGVVQNSTTANILRMSRDGLSSTGPALPAPPSGAIWQVGDVDEKYQFWFSNQGQQWNRVDMTPGSKTYATIVASGTATPSYQLYDWAYVPGGGDFLWSVGRDTNSATSNLVKFNRTAATWTTVRGYNNVTGTNFWGALYASADGFLYGSENTSGQVWKFPVTNFTLGTSPIKIANGPASNLNDGAHCANSDV